jgi:hypothetical protein
MKATPGIKSLAAILALGFLPQPGYSQGSQSSSLSPPVVRQLVPGERVAGVVRATSSRVVTVQHVERVNLAGLGGTLYSTGLQICRRPLQAQPDDACPGDAHVAADGDSL